MSYSTVKDHILAQIAANVAGVHVSAKRGVDLPAHSGSYGAMRMIRGAMVDAKVAVGRAPGYVIRAMQLVVFYPNNKKTSLDSDSGDIEEQVFSFLHRRQDWYSKNTTTIEMVWVEGPTPTAEEDKVQAVFNLRVQYVEAQ